MAKLCKVYYPIEFNSNRIYVHPKFEDDMKKILEKADLKKALQKISGRNYILLKRICIAVLRPGGWRNCEKRKVYTQLNLK